MPLVAGAADGRARASKDMPPQIWAVNVGHLQASRLRRPLLTKLRKNGINTLVVDPTKMSTRQLDQIRTTALKSGLAVLTTISSPDLGLFGPADAASALCAAEKSHHPGQLCAVRASLATAVKLAQESNVDAVVAYVRGPYDLRYLQATHGARIVAIANLRLASWPFSSSVWRRAIEIARGDSTLNLGIATASLRGPHQFDWYLNLLRSVLHPKKTKPASGSAVLTVDPNGNDATCARFAADKPCASLDGAYKKAFPGDTVLVHDGTYPAVQNIYYNTANGKPGMRPVTFTAASPQPWGGVAQGLTYNGYDGPTYARYGGGGGTGPYFQGGIYVGDYTGSYGPPSQVAFNGINAYVFQVEDWRSGTPRIADHITFENAKIDCTSCGPALGILGASNVLIDHVDFAHACCRSHVLTVSDSLKDTVPYSSVEPTDITLDHLRFNDVEPLCSKEPKTGPRAWATCAFTTQTTAPVTLPTATIPVQNVFDAAFYSNYYSLVVGGQKVTCKGTSSSPMQLTGCAGGIGVIPAGAAVAYSRVSQGEHVDCIQMARGGVRITVKNSIFSNCLENDFSATYNCGYNGDPKIRERFTDLSFINDLFDATSYKSFSLDQGGLNSCSQPIMNGFLHLYHNNFAAGFPAVEDATAGMSLVAIGNVIPSKLGIISPFGNPCHTGYSGPNGPAPVAWKGGYNLVGGGPCFATDTVG